MGEGSREPLVAFLPKPKPIQIQRDWRAPLRRFLTVLGLVFTVALGLAAARGIRFPPPRWDPAPRPVEAETPRVHVHADGAYLVRQEPTHLVFRAYVPEPALLLESADDATTLIELQNVHPEARAEAVGGRAPVIRREGVVRHLEIRSAAGDAARVQFRFPERAQYRFAAIGDAGGEFELAHSLERGAELGADFFVHLGDVDYTRDAFEEASAILAAAPLPVYAAIGNHDLAGPWTDMGAVFTELFGPRNSVFSLGGVTFLNLDTANDTIPPMRGARGTLLRRVSREREEQGARAEPLIVFTHRPLTDPRTGDPDYEGSHAVNRTWESTWLSETLHELGAQALLAGHIHESHDFSDDGLPTWVAGEGLGQADVLAGDAVARILIGDYALGGPVRLHWELLQFPRERFSERAHKMVEEYIEEKRSQRGD